MESEQHLRAVLDSLFAFVGVTTPEGVLIEANRAALDAAGLEPEDVLGKPFEEAYWWSYDPGVQARLRTAIETAAAGTRCRYDVVVRLGADRFEPIDFMIAPLTDDEGRVTHLVPSAMVISDRVEVEKELREREERFRTLADNIPQLAWMADPEGWIFWYNKRWHEYTGASLEEMEGWGWRKVHHPDHVEGVVERFRAAIEAGEAWEDTFPLRSAEGEYRWFLSRALPIRNDEGEIVRWFGTNTDVTEERTAAAERERLYREVRAASEAKTSFLSTVSHELRTPLNAIIGYADLLESGVHGELDEAAREAVRRIRLASKHQKELIEDILRFIQLESEQALPELGDVSLSDLFDEIGAVIEPLAREKGLELRIHREESAPPVIHTDGSKLRQVLVNLLGNAVKFTDQGAVSLRIGGDNGRVRFEVEDTGIGLTREQLDAVFTPFWQADSSLTRVAEGNGLGLTISRRLTESLGGEISVWSEAGRGSVFTVELPRGG